MEDKHEAIAARVAADRATAKAAKLPDSLIDWLTAHDASPELFAEAIDNWHKHGFWQSPGGAIWWGEVNPSAASEAVKET